MPSDHRRPSTKLSAGTTWAIVIGAAIVVFIALHLIGVLGGH
jgi:hypothetical protein